MKNLISIILFSTAIFATSDAEKDQAIADMFQNMNRGGALSMYQNSGAASYEGFMKQSNWGTFEKKKGLDKRWAKERKIFDQEDIFEDFKKSVPKTIERLQSLGANSFRFSIEWTAIQPKGPNHFDQEKIRFYEQMISKLKTSGIEPMVTLHHFVHPKWFDDLGSFTKEENIKYFEAFAQKMMKHFSKDVKLWCSFNEPGIHAYTGFWVGVHAPGDFLKGASAAATIVNIFKAHGRLYDFIRKDAAYQDVKLGIVHNPFRWTGIMANQNIFAVNLLLAASAWSFGLANISMKLKSNTLPTSLKVLHIGATVMGIGISTALALLVSAPVWYVLKINEFSTWKIETLLDQYKTKMDFLGFNYYGDFHLIMKEGQERSEYNWVIDPELFYERLVTYGERYGLPIYITENGFPTYSGESQEGHLRAYLWAVKRAQDKLGGLIKGYYYWTLIDNFEWQEGFNAHFGLWGFDFDKSLAFEKSGAKYLRKLWKK